MLQEEGNFIVKAWIRQRKIRKKNLKFRQRKFISGKL